MARLFGSLVIGLGAAAIALVAIPALAQNPHTLTTRLEGPAPTARGSDGDSVFVAAVRKQAEACGMQDDALQVTQERFSIEPATEAEEAALDAKVEDVSAKAGFTGPKEDRQVSRAAIRAMLTERLRLVLEYTGENAAAQMTCLSQALAEAGFSPEDPEPAPFTQAQADAISDACGADRGWMVAHPGGEVQFSPPMEADYEASLCILERIKDSGVTKFGFVGSGPASEGQADD